MKLLKKAVCMLLIMATLLAVPVSAATADNVAVPYSSSFFAGYGTYLYKTSSILFEVWFDVLAVEGMDELGVSYIKVQRSRDGETKWENMREYEPDVYTNMILEDTMSNVGCVTYNGTPGWYYRAYVIFYAKDERGTAEYAMYTDVMQL